MVFRSLVNYFEIINLVIYSCQFYLLLQICIKYDCDSLIHYFKSKVRRLSSLYKSIKLVSSWDNNHMDLAELNELLSPSTTSLVWTAFHEFAVLSYWWNWNSILFESNDLFSNKNLPVISKSQQPPLIGNGLEDNVGGDFRRSNVYSTSPSNSTIK